MAGEGRVERRLRHPAQYVLASFVTACIVGAGLLLLPFATQAGEETSLLTALFTATSAVCVTGLNVVDPGSHWSGAGQWFILLLIQVGGLGIMTLSSLLVVVVSRRLGLRQQVLTAAATGSAALGDVRHLLGAIIRVTVVVEASAALVLALRFWVAHDEAPGRAAFLGVFHAVSAFNNAGFSVFGDSLVGFQEDPVVLLVIAGCIVLGGLGFPVWLQLARSARHPRVWDLHTKVTLSTTAVLLAGGWALFAWFEWSNARTLGPLAAHHSLVNALFHSVTTRTAGFNNIDISGLSEASRLLTEVLMFIGGGSGSTAGGIKVTTFAVLAWVMWAEVRGEPDVSVFERRFPTQAQRQALTVALAAVTVVIVATMLLLATSALPRHDLMFEAISALGTVGLSTDTTPLLSRASQLVVVGLMLIGRVGPLTLFVALVLRERGRQYRYAEERVIIG